MKYERSFVTILDGSSNDIILDLSSFQKERITFGRGDDNDIVLTSPVVSTHHGSFRYQDGHWSIHDEHSTNGIFQNGKRLENKQLVGGDKLLIGYESTSNKVTFVFSQNSPQSVYRKYTIPQGKSVTIGRSEDCDIRLDHVSVLKHHCTVTRSGSPPHCLAAARTSASLPTRTISRPERDLAALIAPFTISSGALSPPIA